MTDHDRLGRPEVEPLSDVAWARVERSLWARLDGTTTTQLVVAARSWRWVWFAAPTFAAAAVIAILIGTRGGERVREANESARVVSGTSPSSLSFGDAHVTLDAESAVVMSRDIAAPSAVLERGGAWFAIAPRRGRPPFVVVAGDTTVRVVGTRFRVARSAEIATVEVEHGLVDVQFHGTHVEVGAGERWSSELPGQVTPVKTAEAEPPKVDDPKSDSADPTGARPIRPAPDVKRPKRSRAKVDPPKIEEPKVEESRVEVADEAADRSRFKAAEALEVRDPSGAIAAYLAVAKSTTKWAALALYSAGRLAFDRKEPRARVLLEMYLQRFPHDRNVDDVRELLARLGGTP